MIACMYLPPPVQEKFILYPNIDLQVITGLDVLLSQLRNNTIEPCVHAACAVSRS
jgi:hypothetical protein